MADNVLKTHSKKVMKSEPQYKHIEKRKVKKKQHWNWEIRYHSLFIRQVYLKLIKQLKAEQNHYLHVMTKNLKFYSKDNTITKNLIIATIILGITFAICHHISYLIKNIQPCHLDLITAYHQNKILIWFMLSSNVTIKILHIKLKTCQTSETPTLNQVTENLRKIQSCKSTF